MDSWFRTSDDWRCTDGLLWRAGNYGRGTNYRSGEANLWLAVSSVLKPKAWWLRCAWSGCGHFARWVDCGTIGPNRMAFWSLNFAWSCNCFAGFRYDGAWLLAYRTDGLNGCAVVACGSTIGPLDSAGLLGSDVAVWSGSLTWVEVDVATSWETFWSKETIFAAGHTVTGLVMMHHPSHEAWDGRGAREIDKVHRKTWGRLCPLVQRIS
jgi:hypothetical protein